MSELDSVLDMEHETPGGLKPVQFFVTFPTCYDFTRILSLKYLQVPLKLWNLICPKFLIPYCLFSPSSLLRNPRLLTKIAFSKYERLCYKINSKRPLLWGGDGKCNL